MEHALQTNEGDATDGIGRAGGSPGDEQAFLQIVREYGPKLARYVRCRIPNASDAEDVLQETFVAVYVGFRRLRDPARQEIWLLHVAQNRCRDYFRRRERREMPLEEAMLQNYVSRFGLHQYRQNERLSDIVDALETISGTARAAAQQFYLQGRSVAEIAADTQRPPGTIKRQLFQARHAVRAALGVSPTKSQERKEKKRMIVENGPSPQNAAEIPLGFPLVRPEIQITELDEPLFAVDCQELRSWPIIPCVGQQASAADYDLPGGKVSEVRTMHSLRPAQVHDVDGVEIEVRTWNPASGWQRPGTVYARLTDDTVEFLAVHLPNKEATQIETFLDDTFAWNWGVTERAISDHGALQHAPDGSIQLTHALPLHRNTGLPISVVRLKIGGKAFTCLRVLEAPESNDLASGSDYYVNESYLTRQGRSLLVRRYCHPRFLARAQFPVVLDESYRRIINGVTLFHWYDTLTDSAL